MLRSLEKGDLVDRVFLVGIVLKGLDGILEVAGGVLLLFVSAGTIDSITRTLTQHELSEDPHDFLANTLLRTSGHLSGGAVRFGAAYLVSHGVVKIVLVAAVLRSKLWAYPWMIAFLLAFIAYQLYRIALAPSAGLIGLTVFDLVIVWLTWREYLRHRQARVAAGHR